MKASSITAKLGWLILLMSSVMMSCITGPTPKDIKRSRAFYRIGVRQSNQGLYRQALAALVRASELNPYDYWIQEAAGGTLLRMGHPKLALKHFKKALELESKSPRGWNNLGTAYVVLGNWKEAIKAFRHALDNILYQTPCFSQMNLGWAYHQNKDYPQARKYLDLSVQTCPRLCQGHRLHGMAMYQQKEYGLAQKSFEKLTTQCKKFPEGHYWLAQSHVAQKHYHAALSPLRVCIQKSKETNKLLDSCRGLLAKTQQHIANAN